MRSPGIQRVGTIDKSSHLHQRDEPEIEQESGFALLVNNQCEQRAEYWEPWLSGSETIRDAIVPLSEFETASELEQQTIDIGVANINIGKCHAGGQYARRQHQRKSLGFH